MKKRFAAISGLLSAMMLSAALSLPVLADTPFYLSTNDAGVGDTVTLNFNSTDLNSVVIRFDPAYFTVTGGTEGYTVSGSNVTVNAKSGQVTFEAKQSGKTYFAVANTSGVDQGSVSYTITGEAAPADNTGAADNAAAGTDNNAAAGTDAASQDNQASATQYDADYTIDGVAYTLSERFSDGEIPARYNVERLEIHGYNYKVLRGPASDVLVYVKHTDNIAGSGVFWHYNQESDTITPMVLLGDTANYVMITNPPALPASNPTPATADINGVSASVYSIAGQDGLFYFYGRSSDGSEGWYQYDTASGAYAPADEAVINTPVEVPAEEPVTEEPAEETPAETETPAEEEPAEESAGLLSKIKSFDPRYLIIGLIALIAIVLIAVVNVVLRSREREEEDEDDLNYDFGRIRLDDADASSYRARMAKINAEDDEEYYQDGMSKYLNDNDTDDEPVLPRSMRGRTQTAAPAQPHRDDRWDYGKLESDPEPDEEDWDDEGAWEDGAPAPEHPTAAPKEDLSATRVFDLPPSLNDLFRGEKLHHPGEEGTQAEENPAFEDALDHLTGTVASSVGEMAQTGRMNAMQPAEDGFEDLPEDGDGAYYDGEAADEAGMYGDGSGAYGGGDDAYGDESGAYDGGYDAYGDGNGAYADDGDAYGTDGGEAPAGEDGSYYAEESPYEEAGSEAPYDEEARRAQMEAIQNEDAPSFTLIDFNDL